MEGHRGLAWYGLDIELEPRERPADPALALLLPPFLVAYEVYLNGQLIGASGQLEPLHRGPNRHQSFPVPAELSAERQLRLRVRVRAEMFDGTFSASHAAGIALGTPDRIASLEDLVASQISGLPILRFGRVAGGIYFGIGLLMVLIFLLDRRRPAYGWYALALFATVVAEVLEAMDFTGAGWYGEPQQAAQWVAEMVSLSALFKAVTTILDQSEKLAKVAVWVPWLVAPLAVVMVIAPDLYLSSVVTLPLETVHAAVCALVGAALLYRGWRARQPYARPLALGFAVTIVLELVATTLFEASGRQAVGGPSAELRAAIYVAADLTFLGTTAVVLALRYRRALGDVEVAYAASERFVPAPFLALLGRDNVVAVERGDSRAQQMTVMFSDIRGFTSLSEHRSPAETFAFINRYLERMEPNITRHGGFINQYFGDGIMALFPSADGALRAARAMQRSVEALSDELEQEGEPGLRVGVGVHTGPLMLGTLGGATRLDTNVIGDAVNLSARIEGMTKQYGCRVLLSAATQEALDEPRHFPLREVDTNRAVGRDEPMQVLQLLDAENEATREGLEGIIERFERGLADYRNGAFDAAKACFDEVLAEVDDGPSRWLHDRCRAYAAAPPTDWDGVTVLESK
ncbi:MAG: hypothetical protein JRI68_26110 [Deltaproteobacteria bacterium]|nr:hypothetical protein [Deltaproteobacteria bacterium]